MQEGNDSGESDADVTSPLLGSRADEGTASSYSTGSSVGVPSTVVEPPNVYRSRWRSIRVMYLTMFLGSVTFTITMSSLWPFLQVLNPTVSASFLGWVVASYSVGQLVASPFFGGWANLRKSSREPLTVSLLLTTLSNFFYMYLQSLPSHKDYFMILARLLIGFSAGNVAVVRSYVSGATTLKERTSSMANVSIFQAIGFILGPAIQAALVPINYPGPIEVSGFHFNMYTAPGFFATCVALVNLTLLFFVFKEHRVYDDDNPIGNIQGKADQDEEDTRGFSNSLTLNDYKPDYVAVMSCIFLFFVVLFMFTVFETIGTPLTMHMYAWDKSKATLYQGIILGVAGCLSIVVFMFVKMLARRFSERILLLVGFIFCFCGYFVFIPWGSDLPPRGLAPIQNSTQNASISSSSSSSPEAVFALFDYLFNEEDQSSLYSNDKQTHVFTKRDTSLSFSIQHFEIHSDDYKSITNNSSMTSTARSAAASWTTSTFYNTIQVHSNTTYTPEGCPWNYAWCAYVPVLHLAQYLGATVFISIGYPMCNMLTYAMYSKVLGPKPQGLWMGWLTAAGSFSRTVGPIYVSQVYDKFGPQVTFGSCAALILITIGFFGLAFRRLVPFSFKDESLTRFGGSVSNR